ncbi:MAG: hypothetical protein ACRDQZ_24035 [Mycobacteriales bacterium]
MAGLNTQTRQQLAEQGKAIPGGTSGGRFPIRNEAELGKAIQAVGRASGGEPGRMKVRRFIIKRAAALGLTSKIPDTWASDGSLK